MPEEQEKQRLESRILAVAVGLCLTLGGWWLQNTWELIDKLRDDLGRHFVQAGERAKEIEYLNERIELLEREHRTLGLDGDGRHTNQRQDKLQ